MEAMTGFFSRAFLTARQMRSEAAASPPGGGRLQLVDDALGAAEAPQAEGLAPAAPRGDGPLQPDDGDDRGAAPAAGLAPRRGIVAVGGAERGAGHPGGPPFQLVGPEHLVDQPRAPRLGGGEDASVDEAADRGRLEPAPPRHVVHDPAEE